MTTHASGAPRNDTSMPVSTAARRSPTQGVPRMGPHTRAANDRLHIGMRKRKRGRTGRRRLNALTLLRDYWFGVACVVCITTRTHRCLSGHTGTPTHLAALEVVVVEVGDHARTARDLWQELVLGHLAVAPVPFGQVLCARAVLRLKLGQPRLPAQRCVSACALECVCGCVSVCACMCACARV
jgi:hypothetical protein